MSKNEERECFIVDCCRSAIGAGKNTGSLNKTHPVKLLSIVLDDLAKRSKIQKKLVEDVICGVVTPVKQQGTNIGRLALLKAGYPKEVPSVQLNRMCGSGQQAIHFACQAILSGDQDIVIGCGVEMMGVVKMGSDSLPECFSLDPNKPQKLSFGEFPHKLLHQGISAELIAERYKISKDEIEEFSINSHKKFFDAQKAGYFKNQIVPIEVENKKEDGSEEKKIFDKDEGVRWPINVQKFKSLKTIFKKNGTITAASSSQVSDGAGAVLLASGSACEKYGLKKRARVVARVVVGSDPEMMLDGVIPATIKCLQKANLKAEEIDVFEINEAFAPVVLAWQKTLNIPWKKVNPNGGAIAHGHPLGATGAILMTKLVNELERTGKRLGLQTMCIGHGMATATIIENLTPLKSKI